MKDPGIMALTGIAISTSGDFDSVDNDMDDEPSCGEQDQLRNRRSRPGISQTFYPRNLQNAGRRMWLLTFPSMRREKEGRMEKFGLLRRVSMIFVVCVATAIASSAQGFRTLHAFDGTDGNGPEAALLLASDGNFYGTTLGGGTGSNPNCPSGCGTVFKITPTGVLTTLHNFDWTDGAFPEAALVQATDGDLYGTTSGGGTRSNPNCSSGCGTVFKITPEGALTTLHNFDWTDGAFLRAALVQASDGNFYGTTPQGGTGSNPNCSYYYGCGTVFKITPTGVLTTLHNFDWTDGSFVTAGLVQASDGNFYGTTGAGAVGPGYGTVFKITPEGALTTLHNFDGNDGSGANGLVQAADGNFYGTTTYGGSYGNGTVFKITPEGALTTLHNFDGNDGSFTTAGLMQASDGNFYGTTGTGGVNNRGNYCGPIGGCGTIFKMTPAGALTTLHNFDGNDGVFANGLVEADDGNVYGTTPECKTSISPNCPGDGTVFSQAIFPMVAYFPPAVNFGYQALNETSAAVVTVTNTGGETLDISVTPSANFPVSSTTCGATLAVGEKCSVSVTFTPRVLGEVMGTLTFTDNAFNSSQQMVPLVGHGVEPVALRANAYYPGQAVGTTSPAIAFTLTNNLNVTLNSIVISTSGDFALLATTCTTTLAAKNNCTISVTFTPTALGTRTGQLRVSDSAGNSPQTAALFGEGAEPVTLPANAYYPGQAVGTRSLAKAFTLTNNLNVTLNNIVISTSGDFAVSATTCATTLAAKNSCTISVTFTPTALGPRTGQLRVSDSASNGPQTLALFGEGAEPVTLPANAYYPGQAVGTTSPAKAFTLTNNLNVTLNNIVISTSGDFAVSATTCATTLAAKSNCLISVTFAPTATGIRTGKLRVSDSASKSPQTSNLTGTGT
jgi:uncharacterized repeat protein (TIGR03803 family)